MGTGLLKQYLFNFISQYCLNTNFDPVCGHCKVRPPKNFDPLEARLRFLSLSWVAFLSNHGLLKEIFYIFILYSGNTDDVHRGLYIMDGSVIPSCIGVNPTLTISGVAERCMALMAKDHHWTIDYNFAKNPSKYT